MDSEPMPPPDDAPSVPVLVRRLVLATLVLFVVMIAASSLLRDPIEHASSRFLDHFGPSGVFFGVLVLDAIPFTVHEPLLFLALKGGMSFPLLVGLAGTGSMLSGGIGWIIGRLVGRRSQVRNLLDRYRIGPFFRRYGVVSVAIAALTPFPYAITTWGAGASDVRLGQVLFGALFRYPKIALYMAIMLLGNEVGAWLRP